MSTEEYEVEEEMLERISELERKLSKCMEERDRVLSMLRRLFSVCQVPSDDAELNATAGDAEWLLNESRNWK